MRVSLIIVAMLAAGCAMRPTVNLEVAGPASGAVVQAWGYPAADGSEAASIYNSLSINLRAARPFVLVLQDGYRVNTKAIDSALLERHFAPITRDEYGRSVARIHLAEKNKRYWMIFSIGTDGKADQLSLYACGHTMRGVFLSADGRRVIDFPIRESEIIELFGGPTRKGRDFEILGSGCD